MRVAFVSSEVHPFSKTGGLADVSQALPAALARLGLDVTVLSPYYRSAAATCARLGLSLEAADAEPVRVGADSHPVRYLSIERDGCRLVFIAHDGFFDRPNLYVDAAGADYPDAVSRFAYFCRAALAYWRWCGQVPDVVHLNDWQTALVPVYLRTTDAGTPLAAARTVFTIHNLAYQGMWPASYLPATGLDASVFTVGGVEFHGHMNLMKGGLVFADAITTVSPSYAEEIQSPAYGRGLDGVLRAQSHKLRGILNGIDVARWNPAADPDIAAPFGAGDPRGKARCKAALQQRCGLAAEPRTPLFGVISRFDAQKGIPLIADALRMLAPLPWQLVVLGAGDAAIEQRMRALAAALPGRVGLTVGFDEALAHQIEAGCDAFLMPSAFEPCGLNQMYSQRYGTIPIVHATGGLRDTVADATPERIAAGTASGFSFTGFDAAHLAEAVLRAWRLYIDAPPQWQRLRQRCMAIDNSWAHSARDYVDLYSRA